MSTRMSITFSVICDMKAMLLSPSSTFFSHHSFSDTHTQTQTHTAWYPDYAVIFLAHAQTQTQKEIDQPAEMQELKKIITFC